MSITDTTPRIRRLSPVSPMFHRRPFLLHPGQSLIAAGDPIQAALDYQVSAEALGISPDHLMASRMTAVAIPENSGRPANRSRRRWEGTRPEMMWLPLLWLPHRLASRYRFQVVDGEVFAIDPSSPRAENVLTKPAVGFEVYTETQDLWALRVALEIEASGVYDTDTGTWFDVLAYIGINVDTPNHLARVQRWLDGADDNDLDLLDTGLELDRLITDQRDPTWALSSALSMHQSMLEGVWARGADSLLGMTDDLAVSIMSGEVTKVAQAKSILSTVCMLAASWMQWYQSRPSDAKSAESLWWHEKATAISKFRGSLDDLSIGPMKAIALRLQVIREDCWPSG